MRPIRDINIFCDETDGPAVSTVLGSTTSTVVPEIDVTAQTASPSTVPVVAAAVVVDTAVAGAAATATNGTPSPAADSVPPVSAPEVIETAAVLQRIRSEASCEAQKAIVSAHPLPKPAGTTLTR